MNKEVWFHNKSLVITQLKVLVLTLLTGENQDHSQRPNLPRTSTEGWRLAPVLIVKCQNCTAHADSGHLLHTSISQWRSVWGTALVCSPVIWVTELVLSSVPLQSMSSFCTVKLGAVSVHFLFSAVHGDILLCTELFALNKQTKNPSILSMHWEWKFSTLSNSYLVLCFVSGCKSVWNEKFLK